MYNIDILVCSDPGFQQGLLTSLEAELRYSDEVLAEAEGTFEFPENEHIEIWMWNNYPIEEPFVVLPSLTEYNLLNYINLTWLSRLTPIGNINLP